MKAKKITFGDLGAEIRAYELPALKDNEVLVKARCSLVSIGTETTLYHSRRWQTAEEESDTEDVWDFDDYGGGDIWDMERNRRFPGYALAGDIIARGDSVKEMAIGDRVIALHNHADFAICPVRPDIILKIPDGVTYEDATFCVLGSVALHAVHRAGLRLGEDVVVMGAGLVGLLTLQLAKLAGGRPAISVDLSTQRLELASRLGADYTVNPNREDPVARIREWIGGEGANCTIEAVGNPAVLQSCMRVCAPGARVVVMGAIVGTVPLDMYSEFIFRELTLIASQQPRNPLKDSIYYHLTGQRNRQILLDMIRTQSINTQDLITHRFSFTDAPEVYRLLGEAKAADYDAEGDVHRDMIGVLFNWQE
jgi:threonine dehydrogenase-like Zn-dependent dehydrogenase